MNHTLLPKELLPDWARRDKQGTKGDRVYRHKGVYGREIGLRTYSMSALVEGEVSVLHCGRFKSLRFRLSLNVVLQLEIEPRRFGLQSVFC
jgi:hypothetical protein